jgi:hypothetical protein
MKISVKLIFLITVKEQDWEICAVQLGTKTSHLIILNWISKIGCNIKSTCTIHSLEFIICGNINISYLNEKSQKKQVNSLLRTYNLSHTEFCNKSSKFLSIVIGNILIDWRMESSGMLHHVAVVRADVSDDLSASIIRATRIGEIVTLAVTSNRHTLTRATWCNIP